jgi:hypothetical protein
MTASREAREGWVEGRNTPRVIVSTRNTSLVPEFGGSFWVRLQYLLGFRDLGVDAYWIDRLDPPDPGRQAHSIEYMIRRFASSLEAFGLGDRFAVLYEREGQCFGGDQTDVRERVDGADVLINIGGFLPQGSLLTRIPRRAYVDVDPGFTQIWAHDVDVWLEQHTCFFTVGQNVGAPEFPIPTRDIPWRPILPPVHLPSWPARIDERSRRFSTVADWRGSQDALFEGEYYGTKRSEFVHYLHVPLRAGRRIEVALCIGQQDHEDLGLLLDHDWRAREAYRYAGDPFAYREFIQYSRAEFGIAKHGYVKSNSGWFSDRTACYLASGKPAIVQSTGFEHRLPTGQGLLTFRSVDEAVAAIQDVEEHYLDHCAAARSFAEEHLDAAKTLVYMLEQLEG